MDALWRHFAWIGIPLFAISAWALVRSIGGVIRTGREARLVDVPLVERQDVHLPEPGPVVLEMEGPIFTRPFRDLEFELTGPDGARAARRTPLLRATSSGVTRGTIELRVFDISVPGAHQLRVEGLTREGRSTDLDASAILRFNRPHFRTSLAYVVGIVLSAGLTIASLVLTALRLGGVGLE